MQFARNLRFALICSWSPINLFLWSSSCRSISTSMIGPKVYLHHSSFFVFFNTQECWNNFKERCPKSKTKIYSPSAIVAALTSVYLLRAYEFYTTASNRSQVASWSTRSLLLAGNFNNVLPFIYVVKCCQNRRCWSDRNDGTRWYLEWLVYWLVPIWAPFERLLMFVNVCKQTVESHHILDTA